MRKTIYTLGFLFVCVQLTAQNATWRNLYLPNLPISTNIGDIVFDRDTNFYVSTDTNLLRYNGGIWSKLTPPLSANEQQRFLAVDNQGGVWVSIVNNGAFRLYNNVWQKYDTSNSGMPDNIIYFMKYDSISKLMIFGTAYGVVTFNSTTNSWTNLGVPPDYTVNFFDPLDVTISKTGEWYFSAIDFRLYIYQPQRGMWRNIAFPSPSLYRVGLDLNNNLYGASSGPQILRYDTIAQSWISLPFMKTDGRSIGAFTVDKRNAMWYFGNEGIIRFDSLKNNKFTTTNSPLYSNSINKVVVGPNNLKYIVGKGGGVQILDDSALPLSTKEEILQTAKMIESYNNPIQQNLVLTLDKNISTAQWAIQIHDVSGHLMSQNVVDVKQNRIELNMAALPAGLYFVTCVDFENKIKETIKVVRSY